MKHTRGPWKVIRRGPCGPSAECFWIGKDWKNPDWRGPDSLGEVFNIFEGSGKSDGNAEANAHLIAAAPDMLEALLVVADHFEYEGKLKIRDDINEIIKKARGEL